MSERIRRNATIETVRAAVSTLTHDLSQPLAAASLLIETLGITRPDEEDVKDAEQQIDRLTEALRAARTTSRQATLEPGDDTSVRGALAAGIAAPVDALAAEIDAPDDRVGCAPALEVICFALAANAGEAGAAHLHVRAELAGDVVRVTVRDDGPGAASLDSLADPYFTTKSHHLGLGLTMCRRVAESRGGSFALTAGDGGGITARFELPIASD